VHKESAALGVFRLKEIIDAAMNMETPSRSACLETEILRPDVGEESQAVSHKIWYDPDPRRIESWSGDLLPFLTEALNGSSIWLFRLQLYRVKIVDTMVYIALQGPSKKVYSSSGVTTTRKGWSFIAGRLVVLSRRMTARCSR
jgi:hypothetical protein